MKKLIHILFIIPFCFLFILCANAQGTWTYSDSLPNDTLAMVQGIAGFSIGGHGYAGLGENKNSNTQNCFWQFDPSDNMWTQKASFPGKARIAPASFVIGNKAYLVTGSVYNAGPCVNECWEYDAIKDSWKRKADFPGGARTYAVGFTIGNKGYVGTGANELNDFYRDFYSYDTTTDLWTRITDFPGIARDGDCGFAINGKGYVCFGQDSNMNAQNDIWEYDTAVQKWTQKTSNPHAMIGACGFVICDNIYVGSGDSTSIVDDYREFWKYNTVSDSWTKETSIPGIKRIQGSSFSIMDTGYYGFGADSAVVPHNVFNRFYAGDSCNIFTGISFGSEIMNVSIYPNPFSSTSTIALRGVNDIPIFRLFDLQGREIKVSVTHSGNEYIIKRGNICNGTYILNVTINNKTINKKLIITSA